MRLDRSVQIRKYKRVNVIIEIIFSLKLSEKKDVRSRDQDSSNCIVRLWIDLSIDSISYSISRWSKARNAGRIYAKAFLRQFVNYSRCNHVRVCVCVCVYPRCTRVCLWITFAPGGIASYLGRVHRAYTLVLARAWRRYYGIAAAASAVVLLHRGTRRWCPRASSSNARVSSSRLIDDDGKMDDDFSRRHVDRYRGQVTRLMGRGVGVL